jgi:Na+-translocating ferredoxin:NAD+ oxidoreductase RnfC subunit
MSNKDLINAVRNAGVVGEGGAGFPAHVKYDAQVETVIANGCECEPLLHSDQYIMQNHAAEIAGALRELVAATGASRGIIATKKKYASVVETFESVIAGTSLELATLDNFYPAGDEQILVRELTGRSIPPLGLPKDVGALVANVGTLLSVSQALHGKPVTHKVMTVTGEVAQPALLRAPIGTPLEECVSQCGGTTVPDPVYVVGGPMMGSFLDEPQDMAGAVVTKTSGGLIVLPRGHCLHEAATLSLHAMQMRAAAACIQCRLCTELCPRYLIGQSFETHKVMRAFGGGSDTAMGAMQAALCCGCGVCELFACPMRLSPRRINNMFKAKFAQEKVAFSGPREIYEEQADLRDYRKVPLPRLAIKLGIDQYMDIHPDFAGDYTPAQVSMPLSQHIGAPAQPVVKPGQRVRAGDLIGEIPEGALGARIHASMDGEVVDVGAAVSIKGT